jgi:anti-sigma B factor antagonist
MHVERTDSGAVSVVRLEGDIDEHGVEALRTVLYEVMTDGRAHVVLNLKEVRFISYLGVGVMVERLRKLRQADGDLKLVGLNLYAQRLFRMVGVSNLFEVYDSEAQALAGCQAAA